MKSNDRSAKVLECLLCRQRYSHDDVASHRYWMETKVCSLCYCAMQSKPHHVSCFGKPTKLVEGNSRRLYGYNPNSPECSRWCPDREVCRRLVPGTVKRLSIIRQEKP